MDCQYFFIFFKKYFAGYINARNATEGKGDAHLHADIRVTHASVDGQVVELVSTVFLHGIQDGLGLEAGGLKRRASNVPSLGMLGDALIDVLASAQNFPSSHICTYKDGSLGIINPVGSKETREGSDEDTAAVVFHSGS